MIDKLAELKKTGRWEMVLAFARMDLMSADRTYLARKKRGECTEEASKNIDLAKQDIEEAGREIRKRDGRP